MKLEGFLVKWLSDSLYNRRVQLCGNEAQNGFEMWRLLYSEHAGGSAAVNLGGMRRLQEWPRCASIQNLTSALDDWRHCLEKYNVELLNAPNTLYHMILQVVPAEYEDELLTRPEVDTWQKIIAWCKQKTAYKRTKALAEFARKPGSHSKINSLLADAQQSGAAEYRQAEAPNDVPPPWAQTMMAANQSIIAALTGKLSPEAIATVQPPPNGGRPFGDRPRGRDKDRRKSPSGRDRSRSSSTGSNRAIRMSVKFKGCWHCGKEDHSRTPNARLKLPGCPEFEALKARNGGKPPADYKGAYERAIDAARAKAGKPPVVKKQIQMLSHQDEDEWEESDLESSDGLFVLGAVPQSIAPNFVHRNAFEDLDDDADIEQDEAVAELSTWATTRVGKRSKKDRKPIENKSQITSVEDPERPSSQIHDSARSRPVQRN